MTCRRWSLTWRHPLWLVVGSLLALGLAACNSTSPRAPKDWQASARLDLDAVHEILRSAHPGAIDEENPGFQLWLEQGYHAAKQNIARVKRYDDILSVIRWYTSGFKDGHLAYSDNIRSSDQIEVLGWHVQERNQRFFVTTQTQPWPLELPPIGAELLSCDDRTPQQLIQENIAPYIDRRGLPGDRRILVDSLSTLTLSDLRMLRCRFGIAQSDGSTIEKELQQSYREVGWNEWLALMQMSLRTQRPNNGFELLADGTLWIRAGNFQLSPEQVPEFEQMLANLRMQQGVRQLVFDSRGNSGGDSRVGWRIFEAATGGLSYDTAGLDALPKTEAFWRVSKFALEAMAQRVEQFNRVYGQDHPNSKEMRDFAESMNAAAERGDSWLRQAGAEPKLTREDMRQRRARLKNFEGPVALITDEHCASACLNFADQVRLPPRALHLGRSTSADSQYIDIGMIKMPSGNNLVLPLKVWRNSVRGNNEILVPDHPLNSDLSDDAAVQREVLRILQQGKTP